MGQGTGGGQPLSDFPELQHLVIHEPWLASADARVRAMWERVHRGYNGHGTRQHYRGYVICRGRRKKALLIVMRQDSPRPVYIKRYDTYAAADADSATLAREIARRVPLNHRVWGEADRVHGTWCVRVVQRLYHVELQIVRRGLIPQTTRRHETVEDAMLDAEQCLTDRYLTN